MSCIPIQDFSLISLCDATKAGKLYSIVPDDGSGDFTAARNSTATYLGADGLIKTAAIDEPRIEFNLDGSYKGLLVEPQRTNLLLRSEEFDNADWTKTDVSVTANATTAPDGELTADVFITNTSNSTHFIDGLSISQTASTVYTLSIFVKPAGYNQLSIAWGASRAFANFNLLTASVINVGTNNIDFSNGSAQILPLKNGWFRCSLTVTSVLTLNAYVVRFATSSNPNNTSHSGGS
jgi:hypothetical protein